MTCGKMKEFASLFHAIFLVLINNEASQDGRADLTNHSCQRPSISLSCTPSTAFWQEAPWWFFPLQWFWCSFNCSVDWFILL